MEKEKVNYDNDEMEIDLLQLFFELKKRLLLIIAAGILCGGVAGLFSKFVLTPQFTSTAMVYILSKETTLTSLADLQIGSQLTQDYKIIVTSRPVLDSVAEQLGLDISYEDMRSKITINNPSDTRILSISAQDPDPRMAKAIADSVANVSSDYIGDIMEMVPPKIIEEGVVPVQKSSPSNGKNAMLGALAGIFLVCGLTVLQTILNDTVQTEDDVEKYLGLTVLASIPLREGEAEEDKDRSSNSGRSSASGSKKGKKRGKRS